MPPKPTFPGGSSATAETAPGRAAVPIDRLDVSAYVVPTDYPEADGTFTWDRTTVVVVEAHGGNVTGVGYTYADLAAATVAAETLAPAVLDRDAMNVQAAWIAMQRQVRNAGRAGIASTAIAAVDVALWDLKSRLLGVPLNTLIGQVRDEVPVYGSGGFTSYPVDMLQRQLSQWVDAGIRYVKMKVGHDRAADRLRVQAARAAIGPDAELMVDANGAWSASGALAMAAVFAEQGVSWFEEPVSSDDLAGLRHVRDRAPIGIDIAAGEYGYDTRYFLRMIESGGVDVLQADATRCGGVSGFLQAAAVCDALGVPLSAHTAPSLHAPLGCAVASMRHVEYFHDHVRIEDLLFDGAARQQNGALRPDSSRPGLGLELKHRDAAAYRAV